MRVEFDEFKNEVNKEIKRRDRIAELSETELVKEYLELTKIYVKKLDRSDYRDIAQYFLETLYMQLDSKRIYICTHAWDKQGICYTSPCARGAIAKLYENLENSYDDMEAVTPGYESYREYGYHMYDRPYIEDFERENIVLNPYDNCRENHEEYNSVRLDYFEYLVQYQDQDIAIEKILKKYPRMK